MQVGIGMCFPKEALCHFSVLLVIIMMILKSEEMKGGNTFRLAR